MPNSSNFLLQPYPEKISQMGGKKLILTVGLQERNRNEDGLAVMPHKEVVFAIGDASDPERSKFGISPHSARVLATRILDMCATAEIDTERRA